MSSVDQPGRFRVGRGPRRTEELLLAELDSLLDESERHPSLLARSVIVVVPSNSLRDHLAARIAGRRGRAAAGLRFVTLFHLAQDVLARAGVMARASESLFEVVVRRRARSEAPLADRLDPLVNGYAAVTSTVRDLLDAGLGDAHLDGVLEQIEELRRREGWRETAAHAAALVRIAVDVARTATELGAGVPGSRWAAAEDALVRDPEGTLPARAVLVHGFADATGTATDLIRALILHRRAMVFLDDPPDPAEPSHTDCGVEFSRRFRERLGAPRMAASASLAPSPAQLELFRAPGAHAEAREVATRIRRLLETGVRPEAILVVARDLSSFALPLRMHLGRLAVPFSAGATTVPTGAAARRVNALAGLVEAGPRTATDRWLDLLDESLDLRVGLRSLGLVTLQAVADLVEKEVLDGDALPLPVRRGFEADREAGDHEDGEEDGAASRGPRVLRRLLPRATLERAVARARRTVALFADWPEEAPAEVHLERVRSLLADALGWHDDRAGSGEALRALASLAADLPAGVPMSRDELALLLRGGLVEAGSRPLGGAGGGVQVLTVVEARGRTAEHLFLLGLNRELFPRPPSEDPLLPDAFRRALRVTLEALPVKLDGHTEERYLFAQLMAAAEHVTVSWQALDDDGRERTVSPLLQRLVLANELTTEDIPLCPSALGAATDAGGLRPALEHAVAAGLAGGRGGFRSAFTAAAESGSLPKGAAAHRLAVVDELDPAPGQHLRGRLGPFFGLIGGRRAQDDPRGGAPAVTTLEGIARCPWQAFLRTVLRLEPPRDPLERVAGLDPLLVGATLHDALEAVVARAGVAVGGSLDDVLRREPVAVPWPPSDELDELLTVCARRVARANGAPALAAALAARVQPFLALARELDWTSGAPAVLGVEVEGTVTVSEAAGASSVLTFRADRIDLTDEGPTLTDYKTGAFVSEHKRESTRRSKLVEAVTGGERLQASAYARATGGRGRYLFLRKPDEDVDREIREVTVTAVDGELDEAFASAVGGLLRLWDVGGFVPRLLDRSLRRPGPACASCDLRAACLQGDSLARRRLALWLDTPAEAPPSEAQDAARTVLRGRGERTP